MKYDEQLAQEFFEKALIPIRIAANTPSGYPGIVSLWFLYENDRIYCATRSNAYIVSKIRADRKTTFEISSENPPYRGIRGWADAYVLPQRGREILERLLKRYLGGFESNLAQQLLRHADDEVAIELRPIWMKTWDFTSRMKDILPEPF